MSTKGQAVEVSTSLLYSFDTVGCIHVVATLANHCAFCSCLRASSICSP